MTLLKPLTSTVVHWGSKELLLAGGVLLAVVSEITITITCSLSPSSKVWCATEYLIE